MGLYNSGSNGRGKPFDFKSRNEKGSQSQVQKLTEPDAVKKWTSLVSGNRLMRRASTLLLTVFAVIVVVWFLAFPASAQSKELIFGLPTSPERLVPIQIKSPTTFPVSMQIYEGLFDLDEHGQVVPGVIKAWESKDNQTWIFHVQEGVMFHSSPVFPQGTREVTAKDVVYSLTKFCGPESYSAFMLTDYIQGARAYNQGQKESVSGIKALDKYTVEITLTRSVPFFIHHISNPVLCVFPRELQKEEFKEDFGLDRAVGTGPYVLKSRNENQIVLQKNPLYWDTENQPEMDRIVFKVIRNDQTRLINLQRGHVDVMVVPASMLGSVLTAEGKLKSQFEEFELKAVDTFNSHLIGINTKAVADPDLRRALYWGTDREAMVRQLLQGQGDVTGGAVPPGLHGYKSPFPSHIYDPEKAQHFLAKSSYSGEEIELLMHDLSGSQLMAQVFQAQMANIGINIKLKKMDFGSVMNKMVKGEAELFSMFFEYAFSSPEPVLISLFSSSKIPVPNFFHFQSPQVDTMLDKLYHLQDRQSSLKLCADIESKVMEAVPAVFLYRQKKLILHHEDVQGLEVNGNSHIFLERVHREQ